MITGGFTLRKIGFGLDVFPCGRNRKGLTMRNGEHPQTNVKRSSRPIYKEIERESLHTHQTEKESCSKQ